MMRLFMLTVICLSAGCQSSAHTDRSTRLTAGDLEAMSVQMANSLGRSPALAGRNPQSKPWAITINQVRNLTSDLISESERWAVVAKLRGQLPLQTFADQKNIRFVLPPDRVAKLRGDSSGMEFDESFGADRRVTHEMSATFRSITRAHAKERTESYYCEFDLIDLQTGEPVWSDRFEFKRSAHGLIWD